MAGRKDIVDAIISKTGFPRKQAEDVLDAILDEIARHLKRGDRVQLPGFGSFVVSDRAARTGRNPKTGEPIQIKASRVARFKMAKRLIEAINDPTIKIP